MGRFARSHFAFIAALLILSAAGALILAQPSCTLQTQRQIEYYWGYHAWQCAFDALSAACGVGLLTQKFDGDYTAAGRWVLTGVGVVGAMLFIAAVAQAVRRLDSEGRTGPSDLATRNPVLTIRHAPRVLVPVVAFLVLVALAAVSGALSAAFSDSEAALSNNTQATIAAVASLGFVSESAAEWNGRAGMATPALLAAFAWLGALGWPLWFMLVPRLLRAHVRVRHALVVALAYTLLLGLIAVLICMLEAPRGGPRARMPAPPVYSAPALLSDQPAGLRLARSAVQTACAAGAGIPTEQIADRGASEGTKVTLALTTLLGASGFAAGGGITWLFLLWALTGLFGGTEWRGSNGEERIRSSDFAMRSPSSQWITAGATCVVAMLGMALLCALGLLLIENLTASRFTPAPTFADALLDACSAVGGGALTGGLTERVTDPSLVSGIRQDLDLYPFGMVWLMLAMLGGRIVPLILLRRIADRVGRM